MPSAVLPLAQQEAPDPVLPETNEWIWSATSVVVLLVLVVVAIFLVKYLINTRRIAEAAAREARELREELKADDIGQR